jgi:hypothetical protein
MRTAAGLQELLSVAKPLPPADPPARPDSTSELAAPAGPHHSAFARIQVPPRRNPTDEEAARPCAKPIDKTHARRVQAEP